LKPDRKLPDRKLRVGVSIHLRSGGQSMWENGIFQNCAFLVQLLKSSPVVEDAFLINGGDDTGPAEEMMLAGADVHVLSLPEALDKLDVAIEMSSLLPEDWTARFREKGGRYAWMRVGNDYVLDIERAMFDLPPAALLGNKKYDAIWTLPQYEQIAADYFALSVRAPVRILPHLWTPHFFDRAVARLPSDVKFGYEPGKPRWRVCMFEPNVSLVKTSWIPMLLCEEAYRARPSMMEGVRVLNTWQFKDEVHFVNFARTLDMVNHGVATFEVRYPMYEYMARHGDCVVSHQWENAQNYIYYEALYGGYPLVHNSPIIRDCGYYYPDFDCQEGGRALVRAFDEHDANLPAYRDRAKRLLWQLDIENPENVQAYTRELLRLYEE
jgi:hypothetical protein